MNKKDIPLFKKVILKWAASGANGYGTLKPDKVKKIICQYLKTGQLSKSDAVDIYSDVRGFVWGFTSAVPIAIAMIVTFSFTPMIVFPIAFILSGFLTSRGTFLSIFFPKNLSTADIKEYEKLVKETYDNDKAKSGIFKNLFKK